MSMFSRLLWVSLLALTASAAEHRGRVEFNALPVPGATVKVSQNGVSLATVTDDEGSYLFPDLADGGWTVEVQMLGFDTVKDDITVAPMAPARVWQLHLLPLDKIKAQIQNTPPPLQTAQTKPREPEPERPPSSDDQDELRQHSSNGFLINGSANNGAASVFAQAAAFGNNRFGGRSRYNGGIAAILGNSAFDARPFSLTGQDTPKSAYNRTTGVLSFGGPLLIPHLLKNGPNVFVGYQWTRNNNASAQTALVPTEAQRNAPSTPQSRRLLDLYPLPNFTGNGRYNYQVSVLSPTHQDALESRFNKSLNARNQLFGGFNFQSTRAASTNLFGFLDTRNSLGMNANANYTHRFGQRWFFNTGYRFSRLANRVNPFFANGTNVSGQAGISGNNQDPSNWGPPSLIFSSGIASLSDSESSFTRNQTSAVSLSMLWNRGAHNITFGTDFRRQQFNYLGQQDPRGTLTFTGNDFADFLHGIPAAASIAYGNADKYFRQSVYDAYFTDDWRINSKLTLNAGLRWDYGVPITERYGRLVNLDIAPYFTAAASSHSLLQPDKRGVQPRIGLAWRPISASSLVIRAGYGIYYDTSVYLSLANEMAQQPPLSKTFSIQNTVANPFTIANAFTASPAASNTFAVDPAFRVGYAQNWQISVQRALPASLELTATYLGIKGTRGAQEFLPNTYPLGAANPCPDCPIGFVYLTSNGNSTRQSAQLQLRRRLHSGLATTLSYTFSKSIDNMASFGGQQVSATRTIAQNWRDLSAERALSPFDQRHLLTLQTQYTTGMGPSGSLLNGRAGALLKQWTLASQITLGSGLPESPVYLAPVPGTGFTGTLRPSYLGGSPLDPASYTTPSVGQWGNAPRNSITGPSQFAVNASLARTFQVGDRFNLDLRFDAINALNTVTYTSWNTIINSAQFGVPAAANSMRSVQTTLRLRF